MRVATGVFGVILRKLHAQETRYRRVTRDDERRLSNRVSLPVCSQAREATRQGAMGRVRELHEASVPDGHECGGGDRGVVHCLCSHPERASRGWIKPCARSLLYLP